MKTEFLNVFSTRAREYLVANFGRPLDLEQLERDLWHERLGLLVDFSHSIVADVADMPLPTTMPAADPTPDWHASQRFVKLDADRQPIAPDASDFFAVYDNKQKLTILARNLGDGPCARNSGTPERLIAEINAQKELGRTDWRLPEVEELFLLADRKRWNPAVPPALSWIKPELYHTTSPDASDPADCAWFVDLYSGSANINYRDARGYVLAVSGGAPSPGQ